MMHPTGVGDGEYTWPNMKAYFRGRNSAVSILAGINELVSEIFVS